MEKAKAIEVLNEAYDGFLIAEKACSDAFKDEITDRKIALLTAIDALKQDSSVEAEHDKRMNDKDIPHVWAISRPIPINGCKYFCYMCDENGKVKLYDDFSAAKNELVVHGYSEDDIVDEGIEIVEMQENGDYYEPIAK